MVDSPLMSDVEAMEYLRTTKKGLLSIMLARGLARHPQTGHFARVQVERIAKEIEKEILEQNEAGMEREGGAMGGVSRFRTAPKMVPVPRPR